MTNTRDQLQHLYITTWLSAQTDRQTDRGCTVCDICTNDVNGDLFQCIFDGLHQ